MSDFNMAQVTELASTILQQKDNHIAELEAQLAEKDKQLADAREERIEIERCHGITIGCLSREMDKNEQLEAQLSEKDKQLAEARDRIEKMTQAGHTLADTIEFHYGNCWQ